MSEQPLSTVQNSGDGAHQKRSQAEEHKLSATATKEPGQSIEENLERLAAVNLSSDRSLEPRLSTAMIRLVSALAGIGVLVLLYLLFRLFV